MTLISALRTPIDEEPLDKSLNLTILSQQAMSSLWNSKNQLHIYSALKKKKKTKIWLYTKRSQSSKDFSES